MGKKILLPSILVVLALAACGKEAAEPKDQSPPPTVAESPGGTAATTEAAAASPAPLGLISSRGEEVQEPPAGATAPVGRLEFDLPPGWPAETPETDMRLAQATIPGAGGPGQLAVFYFGPGGGGGVEENIARWIGQMQPRPGAEPKRDKFEANNCIVTWIEIEGTLMPSQTGMGPSGEQPDSILLAAVVEGTGGPWFFKATGPAKTLKGQREAFFTMLRAVRTP